MITFSTGFDKINYDDTGSISEVPLNSYLKDARIERNGVVVIDIYGNWGVIEFENTTLANNKEVFNYLYNYTLLNKPQTAKVEICGADFQTSNSIPIDLVSAPGIGLMIKPFGFGYKYRYGSVPFDFAANIYVHNNSNTDANAFFEIQAAAVNAGGDRSSVLSVIGGDAQLVENDKVILKAKTSDATQGDGYITVYMDYTIIEESWHDGVYCV